jgi:ParB-like chromosome segregation protein Spo0J
MTAQTQNFQYVPLNNLVVSPRNVRRKDRKADIDALAASISSRGLLAEPLRCRPERSI